MDQMEESSCPSSSPIIKIVPKRSSHHGKPSNFSILHKANREFNGTCFSEDPPPDSECRICLQGDYGMLIKPCRCTGTVQYAHEACLREWIRTKVEKGESKVACELCQADYNYDQEEDKKLDCTQLIVSWKKRKRGMALYLAFQFLALFLLGGLIGLTIIAGDDEGFRAKVMPNQPVKLAYAMAIVLCSLFAALIIILFVGEFCVRHEVTIRVRKHVPTRQRASVRSARNSLVHI